MFRSTRAGSALSEAKISLIVSGLCDKLFLTTRRKTEHFFRISIKRISVQTKKNVDQYKPGISCEVPN